MNRTWRKLIISGALLGSTSLLAWEITSQAQNPPAEEPKTAEKQFKNVQVLKDITAGQLIPSMQFISASLGVDCEFCHVQHQMDKDDKKEKVTARKMIAMELAINKAHFDGQVDVTCYTCHRGSPHPVGTPILSAEAAPKPPLHSHEEITESHEVLPAANVIFDKYLAAVGGADSLNKVKTRVETGTIDTPGGKYPVEVYSEAPEKRVTITHPPSGESVTAFNGDAGWMSIPGGVHRMSAPEREAMRLDAALYFPQKIREMYPEFKVRPGEPVGGRPTYLLAAQGTDKPSLRLYFDQETGLLLRQVRLAQTPLGQNPTQIDYADYRDADGVKIPYQWTLSRPGGSFTIHIEKLQQNIPVDEKLFVPPPEPAHP
jgi:photosynthetic reaction center cytochrome c subunit